VSITVNTILAVMIVGRGMRTLKEMSGSREKEGRGVWKERILEGKLGRKRNIPLLLRGSKDALALV